MRNLNKYLTTSLEENQEGEVNVQDGGTPEEGFGGTEELNSTDTETADPATSEVPAASEGAEGGKTTDQGSQTTHTGNETYVEGEEKDTSAQDDGQQGPSDTETGAHEAESKGNKEGGQSAKTDDDAPAGGEVEDTPTTSDDKVSGDTPNTPTQNVSTEEEGEGGEEVPVQVPADTDGDGEDDTTVPVPPDGEGEEPDEVDLDNDGMSGAEVTAREVGEVTDDIEGMVETHDSMEAFYNHLAGSLERGGLSGHEADALRMGLEQVDAAFGDDAVVASTESFGGVSSPVVGTEISMEAVKDKMEAVWEAIKKAIRWLFQVLKDLWHRATGGFAKIHKRVGDLRKRVSQLSSNAARQTANVSGTRRLTIDGQFAGNDLGSLHDLSQVMRYATETYPKEAQHFVKAVTKDLATASAYIDVKGGPNEYIAYLTKTLPEGVKKSFSAIPAGKEMSGKDVAPTLRNVERARMGSIVAGNKALVQYAGSVANHEDVTTVEGFRKFMAEWPKMFKVKFMDIPDARQAKGSEETYEVPDKNLMLKLLDTIDGIANQGEKMNSVNADFKSIQKDIEHVEGTYKTAIRRGAPKSYDENGKVMAQVNPALTALSHLPGLLINPISSFVGYSVSTLNAYLAVLEYNLKLQESAAKKASKQSAGALPNPAA